MPGQGGRPPPSSARSVSSAGTMSPRRTRSSGSDSVRTSDGLRSILTDNTQIDVPGRKSWYKRINQNSIDKINVMDDNETAEENFDIENVMQADAGPSQLRKLGINVDNMSDTSTSESIASIQIPQRKLFTHRQNQHLENENINKKEQVESDSCNESMGSIRIQQKNLFTHKQTKQADAFHVKITKKPESLRKDMNEKTIYLPKKDLFKKDKETVQHKAFPVSINSTTNTTKNKKVDSSIAVDTGGLKKNLFGIRQTKKADAFPISLMSESDDDTLKVQERLTALKKNPPIENRSRRISVGPRSAKRAFSNASFCSETIEFENWKSLPSSTVIGEDFIASTPLKKICRNKIQDIIEDVVDPDNEQNFVTEEVPYTEAKELHVGTSKVEHKNSSKVQHTDHSKIKDKSFYKLEQRDGSHEKLNNTSKTQTRNQSKLDQQDDSKIKLKNTSNLQDRDHSKLLERNGDSKAENKNTSNMQLRNRSKLEQKDNSKEHENMFEERNKEPVISKEYTEKVIEDHFEEVDMAQASENMSNKNNETNKEDNDQVEASDPDIDDIEEKSIIRSDAESDYDQQEECNYESEIENDNQEKENGNMNEIGDQSQINKIVNCETNNTEEVLQLEDVEMENVSVVASEDHVNKENAVGNKLIDQNYEQKEQESVELENEPEAEQNENLEDNISDHHDDKNYQTELEQNYSKEYQSTSDQDNDDENEVEQNESQEDQNTSDHEHNETKVEQNETQEDQTILDHDDNENTETEVEQNERQDDHNTSVDDEHNEIEVSQNESQEDQNISDNDDNENNGNKVENESQEDQNNSDHSGDDGNNESKVEQNDSQEDHNVSVIDCENNETEVKHNQSQKDQNFLNHHDDDDGNNGTEVEYNESQEDKNISDHNDDDGHDESEVEHNDSQEDENISDHNNDSGNDETEVEHNDSQENENLSNHNDDDINESDEIEVDDNMSQEEQDDSELGDKQNDGENRMDTAEEVPAENLSDDEDFRVVSFKSRRNDTLSKSQSERDGLTDGTIDVKKSNKSQNNSVNFFKNNSIGHLEIDPGRMSNMEHSNRGSAEFSKNMSDGARSSIESSGWNSHTTAYIQRAEQTMNARKSLRALVLHKNAKVRPSTKEIENSVDDDEHDFTRPPTPIQVLNYSSTRNESDINKSMNISQTKITTYLRKIAQENLELQQKIQKKVKKSMRNPVSDPNFQQTYFQYSNQPKPTASDEIVKTKKKNKNQNNILNVVLDGKVSKPPKATWITVHLYKFLHDRIQPRTDVRYRSEMFVRLLLEMYKLCLKRTTDVRRSISLLKKKMAVLRLVDTHFEFYKFVEDFMPKEFRLKVIPNIINNLPIPADIYSSIIPPDSIHRS